MQKKMPLLKTFNALVPVNNSLVLVIQILDFHYCCQNVAGKWWHRLPEGCASLGGLRL